MKTILKYLVWLDLFLFSCLPEFGTNLPRLSSRWLSISAARSIFMFSHHGRRHRAMISSEDIPVTRLNKQFGFFMQTCCWGRVSSVGCCLQYCNNNNREIGGPYMGCSFCRFLFWPCSFHWPFYRVMRSLCYSLLFNYKWTCVYTPCLSQCKPIMCRSLDENRWDNRAPGMIHRRAAEISLRKTAEWFSAGLGTEEPVSIPLAVTKGESDCCKLPLIKHHRSRLRRRWRRSDC